MNSLAWIVDVPPPKDRRQLHRRGLLSLIGGLLVSVDETTSESNRTSKAQTLLTSELSTRSGAETAPVPSPGHRHLTGPPLPRAAAYVDESTARAQIAELKSTADSRRTS